MNCRIKWSIILIAMVLSVSGCSRENGQGTQETVLQAQEESRETQPSETETQNAAEEPDSEQDWDFLVSEAILSENQGRYTGEECAAEGHRILGMEESGTETKIYALTMYGEYQFQNGNFVKGSGSGVIPAVLVFRKDDGGAYTLNSYEMPDDGSGYVESIEKMFPEKFREICISPTEEVRAELENQEKSYASEYLKTLGRTAAIGTYRDFEHLLLTDAGVSVEVSNRLMENKDISNYPSEIGNLEVLENGVRYVYQMDYEPEKKRIILTKTEYDSGKVEESYLFDSETGEHIPDVDK